jgi:hypothetical protein
MPLTFQILLIDDDADDQLLIKAAWEKIYPVCNLTWISHDVLTPFGEPVLTGI